MITYENYIWYIKGLHLTTSILIATGILIRWKIETKARRMLAFLFLMMTVFYTIDVILALFYELHPFMLTQNKGFAYSFGSLYNGMVIATFTYLYTRTVFKPEKLTARLILRVNSVLVISVLVYGVLSLLGFRPVPGYDMTQLFRHMGDNPFVLLWLLTVLSFYVYTAYISFVVVRWMIIHRRNIKNNFSLVGDFRYYYIYVTYVLFGLTLPLGIFALLYKGNSQVSLLCAFFFTFIIILISVFSYLQRDIYSEELPMEDIETDVSKRGADEKHQIRFNDRRLIEKLRILVEEEHIYTQPDLSAETLACRMEISRKKLYLFLKEYYGSIFSDYINGCRIGHAEMLMEREEFRNLTILEISEMSGFNSVGTFSKFFKAKHFTTPAKYRNTVGF